MNKLSLEIKEYEQKIKLLFEEEEGYKKNIIKNSLSIESFFIYFETLNLISKKEIKSKQIIEYLMFSKQIFIKNFELLSSIKETIKPMKSEENNYFKEELLKENEMVKKLVRNLNNIFTIQYENYSWITFNEIYGIEKKLNKININKINRKLDKLLEKIKLLSNKQNKEKERENIIKQIFSFSEESNSNIGIMLIPNVKNNYALK